MFIFFTVSNIIVNIIGSYHFHAYLYLFREVALAFKISVGIISGSLRHHLRELHGRSQYLTLLNALYGISGTVKPQNLYIVRFARRGQCLVVPGPFNWLMATFPGAMPTGMLLGMVARMQETKTPKDLPAKVPRS